jgi:SPP1 family predicted phage head-tail adaptor
MAIPGGIGSLRHRIELQELTLAQNTLKEDVPTYTTVATVWARLENKSGRESFTAQQVNATSVAKFTIRYYAGLTTRHRIKFGTRTFNIFDVNDDDERHEFMIVMAREITKPKSS